MSDGKSESERRKFARIPLLTSINYSIVVPSSEKGITRDISQDGLALEGKKKMDLGAIVKLEFDLPGDKPERIEALGKVIWQKDMGAGVFITGIKFLT